MSERMTPEERAETILQEFLDEFVFCGSVNGEVFVCCSDVKFGKVALPEIKTVLDKMGRDSSIHEEE